jgi:hypothetical protein
MGWLKNKLKMFKGVQKGDFTNLKNYFRDKQTEFFSEEEERSSKDAEIFKTVNLMD